MKVERMPQRLGLHDVGMARRTVAEWAYTRREPVAIDVNQKLETEFAHTLVAERDHLAKLPGGVDMQQRKRRLAGMESLHRQMQQYRGVLADRIEHDGLAELG